MTDSYSPLTILMTGATSGFGKVAAIHKAGQGHRVIVFARNDAKAKALDNAFREAHPNSTGSIEIVRGNLSRLGDIVAACKNIHNETDHLDQLVLNAGIMNFQHKHSEDGIEETLQVNLLAPLLMCHLLIDLLKKGRDAKIIITASGLHQGVINFDDPEFKNNWSCFATYRQSKLGVIQACRVLAPKLAEHHIAIYAQHPGVVRTELGRTANAFSRAIFWLMGASVEQGAQTLIYLQDTPNSQLTSGEYYTKKAIKKITAASYDMDMAQKLMDLVGNYLRDYLREPSIIFDQIPTT